MKRWLVDEISESIPQVLDFLREAKNSEKCMHNFQKLSPHMAEYVYAPKVLWDLSTSKILTMEFMDATQVNDAKAIQGLGIQALEVAKLVTQTFAEMVFKHGFVHCDLHAANILVRPLPSGSNNIPGKRKPQLILLDHGLYRELDFETRYNYAAVWKALIFVDVKSIIEHSIELGAGGDLSILFVGMLTMKPWNRYLESSIDRLVLHGDDRARSELQMYAYHCFPEISELLMMLPPAIFLLLKANDSLRSVNTSLLQGSFFHTSFIMGKVSSEAYIEAKKLQKKYFFMRPIVWLEQIWLGARLLVMRMNLWVYSLKEGLN